MAMPMPDLSESRPTGGDEAERAERWRLRLLPLMTRMLVGLAIFFFVVSLAQITYLHWRVEQTPAIDFGVPMTLLSKLAGVSPAGGINAADAMIDAKLEANALERRYHQASIVLMARVWTSYMGFVTGMILALVGAVFILGRVHESDTEIEAKFRDASGVLKTSAPGIVLASLGVAMMISTLFVRYDISVTDSAVYARTPRAVPPGTAPQAPDISFPPVPTAESTARRQPNR
jgi:hypothetical protein